MFAPRMKGISAVIRLYYLPLNSAWGFFVGEGARAELLQLGDYPRFFATRSEAMAVADAMNVEVAA